jgi:hypothetical protein
MAPEDQNALRNRTAKRDSVRFRFGVDQKNVFFADVCFGSKAEVKTFYLSDLHPNADIDRVKLDVR